MSVNAGLYTSATAEWATPPALFNELDAVFGFDVDVCATHDNAKCDQYFTEEEDGLTQDWSERICFMNPPYGTVIGQWVEKAYTESKRGATVVCLLPARTDTGWFQKWCSKAQCQLFLRGRVKFGDGQNSAPFPSVIVVFSPRTWDMRRLEHLGLLYYRNPLGIYQVH